MAYLVMLLFFLHHYKVRGTYLPTLLEQIVLRHMRAIEGPSPLKKSNGHYSWQVGLPQGWSSSLKIVIISEITTQYYGDNVPGKLDCPKGILAT